MTINHKPATALPFKRFLKDEVVYCPLVAFPILIDEKKSERGNITLVDSSGKTFCRVPFNTVRQASVGCADDNDRAHFIVHSANAYPRLVEVLRKTAEVLAKEYGVPFDECVALEVGEARALLSDLGEL